MAKRRSRKVHSPKMPRKVAATGVRSTAINPAVRFALKAYELRRKLLSKAERAKADRRLVRALRLKAAR